MKLSNAWLPLSTFIFLVLQGCSSSGPSSEFRFQGELPNENPFLPKGTLTEAAPLAWDFFLTSNLNGEIAVCGCAVNPKGGLDRRWNYLEKMKTKNSLSLDAGNALFAQTQIDASKEDQLKAKALFISETQSQLGVVAQNVGRLDLSAGLEFLIEIQKKSKLNWISSNLKDSKGNFPFPRSFEIQISEQQKLLVLGLTDAESNGEWSAEEPAKVLQEFLSKTNANHLVVVLSDLGEAKDRSLMKQFEKNSMIFVGSRELGFVETPIQVGKSVLVRPGFQGQTIGHFQVKHWPNRSGWFVPEVSSRLHDAFDGLKVELDSVREKGSAEEISRIENQWRENIYWYGKSTAPERNRVDFEIVGLGDAYAKPNAISKKMKAFQ